MFGSPKRSALISGLLHAAAILSILALTRVVPTQPVNFQAHSVLILPSDLADSLRSRHAGGGGGGVRDLLPASRGRLPRQALRQFTPPMVKIVNPDPKLIVEPTILVSPRIQLPSVDLAQYGIPNGVIGPLSGGPGDGGGIGPGSGTGVGPGKGPGYGEGPGGTGFGNGSAGFQGALTPPSLVYKTEPEYSDEARKAKVQGVVVLAIQVDPTGQARDIVIRQSLGLGLDERAVEAVRRWRFRPGTRGGKPIASPALIEVFFRLL